MFTEPPANMDGGLPPLLEWAVSEAARISQDQLHHSFVERGKSLKAVMSRDYVISLRPEFCDGVNVSKQIAFPSTPRGRFPQTSPHETKSIRYHWCIGHC